MKTVLQVKIQTRRRKEQQDGPQAIQQDGPQTIRQDVRLAAGKDRPQTRR